MARIILYYYTLANCGHPPMQQSNAEINDSIKIIGSTHNIPVMEGATVSFSCHPGLLLHGPNSSTHRWLQARAYQG